jgi:hypothetical protein
MMTRLSDLAQVSWLTEKKSDPKKVVRFIKGNKYTVFDLMLDNGVDVRSSGDDLVIREPLRTLGMMTGISILFDTEMPKGVVELRNADGDVLHRWVKHGSGWYIIDLPVISPETQ